MGRTRTFCSAMALAFSGTLTATAAADAPPKAPAKIVLDDRRYEVNADASATQTVHLELQILDNAAIQAFGQQTYSYSESTQDLQITEAYTLKKDGTKLPVAPGAIITQQRPGTSSAPMLTDQKQKVILFPNVEVGDTMVSFRTMTSKPLIPQLYSYGAAFPTSVEIGRSDMTFITPKSLPLYFDTKDVSVTKSTKDDKLVYAVHYENAKPVVSSTPFVSIFDRSPLVFVSSFKNYEQFAKAYGALALPKITITPQIQAKADEITAGVTDRREQVNKIYDWVASHVRYVALEFGQGSIVAHDPEEVMLNAYGDCKDHSVLFAALLKAKGIQSELVIINATNSYFVPSVPTPVAFDHMINWIPELSLYADTTQRSLPLGLLPPTEYGKTVVHFGGSGKPVHKVPVLSEKESTFAYTDHLKLDDQGRVSAEGKQTATGIAAAIIKRVGATMQSTGLEKSASEFLNKRGMPNATGSFDVPQIQGPVREYTIGTHYQTQKRPKMISGEAFAMPRGLVIDGVGGDFALGPIATEKYKNTDIVACYSNHGSEDYTLEFPAGKHVATLPADTTIKTDNLKFTAHWSVSGHSVSVHRDFVAHFDEPLCRGSQTKDIHEALKKIHDSLDTTIALVPEQAS